MTEHTFIRELPIIFSDESIQAILGGHKAVTKRIIKPQPKWVRVESVYQSFLQPHKWYLGKLTECLYGVTGDIFWVKEAWKYRKTPEGFHEFEYKDGLKRLLSCPKEWLDKNMHYWNFNTWKSPGKMPYWAARLRLKSSSINVERLKGTFSLYYDEILDSKLVGAKKIVDPWIWLIEYIRLGY